jgi:hypothetical protein
MKCKIQSATWTTRSGFADEKVHQGWSVTTPTAMGTTTRFTESYAEAERMALEIEQSNEALDNYCINNAWTRMGT